jgi:hypothetical protein
LVLQVEAAVDNPAGSVVVVAYATSQRTTTVYPGEFVIGADSKAGLAKDTKFDLVNRHRLPFDDVGFAAASGKTPHYPRRGRLDLQDVAVKRKLHSAITEAKNLPRSY